MADEVASLLVKITADGTQAVGVLNGVSSTVETLANKNASLLNKVSSVGTLAGNIGRVITKTFGVATVAGLTASAKAAGQLNKELANIGTLSVPTERLHEFKGQIQDVAIATGKSTSDISDGTYQVVSAFGDAADTMEKVEINAKAARAGLATTTDSINLTSAVTKAYGDTSAGAVQHVADLAFKTVELGQTTFPELAQNMQQVTSLSKELGVSQEELFGAYATLTGVTGNAAEVQTQMKAIYTAMLKPSKNMQKVIESQGYASGFAMVKALGFAGTLNALKSATNGSEEEMLGLFNNVRAMPAVMALTGAQADTFSTKLGKMKEASGAATKAFEVQTEGVAKTGFTLEQAKVKMQVAAQNFGESAAPIIADFADIVDKASTKLSTMSDEERKAVINTGLLTTKIGVGLSIGGKALTLGTKLVGTAKAIGPAVISGITSPVGLATLAIAGVTAATYAGVKAYEEYKADWSRGGKEMAESIRSHVSATRELNDLQYELRSLQQVVNNPETDENTLNVSKARIEEIKQLLSEKYNLDITVNDGGLDAALEKAKQIQLLEAKQDIPDLLDYSTKNKDDYYGELEKQDFLQGAINGIKQEQDATGKLRGELLLLNEARKSGRISQEEYTASLNKLIEATGNPTLKDMPLDVLLNGTAIQDWLDRLNSQLTTNEGLLAKSEATTAEYVGPMQDLANAGLLEIEFGDAEQGLSHITTAVQAADLSMNDWAVTTALAMNNIDHLSTAWEQAWNGDNTALTGIVNDYIRSMKEFGASAEETAIGASLIQNGFRTVEEAAKAGKLDVITQQADELAHSMGLIPEDKHIVINADGDISIIEDVQSAVDNVNTKGDVNLQVSATGDISVLDTADEKLKELINNNQVTIKFNAETNGFDISDVQGNKLGEITADGKINWIKGDVEKPKPEDTDVEAKANYTPGNITKPTPDQVDVNAKIHYTATGDVPKGRAKGDMNFPGGLAMVNDERGISDNRELIVDRGRAFIPEGRDVILPLSKGAKVYTAAQTKAIMSGLGIPHYAKGKDNSDAFTAAKDDWTQYKNTHAVTVTQELQKWVELSEKFTSNQKDVQDIQEQIFSLMQKQTKELNDQARAYLEERSALNDWEDIGDSPLAAFGRVKERNMEEVKAGRQTWDDFTKTMKDMGSDMYNARISQSKKWLDHEEKYNGMSVADTLAGIDRMREYTREYYEQGIISHREYIESKTDLDEMYIDKVKEGLSEQFDISKAYISDHTYFNDWQDSGDDPLEAYNRVMDRHREALANGELTQKEFDEYGQKLGSSMYSERKEQSLSWLDEQRKYFGMTDEEYVQGLERIKAYIQEYYDQGLISRREYNEAMTELNHSSWDEASEAYDDMLKEQQDYINKMQEEFQKQEQALRDSWTVEDRKVDMAEVAGQLDIYAGAVTDRGQQKYKELEEQMKQLQRDEELYRLQVKNTATIDALQSDYEQLEADKADFLRNIVTNTDINVSGIVGELTSKIAGSSNDINHTLSEIIDAIRDIKMEQQNFNDSRQINITTNDASVIEKYMEGS